MNFIEIILSSAVVVAAIGLIKQNKINRLQYVTQERSKWRNEIKAIAEELVDKNKDEIYKPLTKLKVQLNGYGANVGNRSKESLDVFKDEHIWQIIYKLEGDCDADEFKSLKNDLILYLSLLLKFDWERSKEEVKTNNMIVVSIAFWVLSIVIIIFAQIDFMDLKGAIWLLTLPYDEAVEAVKKHPEFTKVISECIGSFTMMCMLYLLSWGPYIAELIFKTKKWYRTWSYMLVTWIVSISMVSLIYLGVFRSGNIFVSTSQVFMMLALVIPIVYILKQKEYYINYDNSVLISMKEDSLTVYYKGFFSGFLHLSSYLIRLGVNYKSKDTEELVKEELLEETINYLWNGNDTERHKIKTILKGRYAYLFWKKYKQSRNMKEDLVKYIKEKPKRSKLIVIHKIYPDSEIEDLWPEKKKNRKWHKKILWIEKNITE